MGKLGGILFVFSPILLPGIISLLAIVRGAKAKRVFFLCWGGMILVAMAIPLGASALHSFGVISPQHYRSVAVTFLPAFAATVILGWFYSGIFVFLAKGLRALISRISGSATDSDLPNRMP